jgi:peptidoglycan/LPS O-acetylase OafA/YrhL
VTAVQTNFGVERKNDQGFLRTTGRKGSTAQFKVRGVEGWRGIAALAVIAVHAWQVMDTDGDGLGPIYETRGLLVAILSVDLAVDLFFVLSGLLLFLPFVLTAFDDDRAIPSGDDFLWRRVFRFIPTYWLLVVICWSTRNFGITTADWLDLVEHLLLVQAFDSDRIFATIGPAWTLSVDWMFYVALAIFAPPWMHWVRRTASTGRRVLRLMTPITVVTLMSVLYKINVDYVWNIETDRWAWRFGPAAKADDFAIGMVVAVLMVWLGSRRIPVTASLALALSGGYLLFLARRDFAYSAETLLDTLRHPVGSVGWALVLVAVMACRSDRPARWVDNPAFLRLSVVAFTVYLVHEPVALAFHNLGWINQGDQGFLINFVLISSVALWLAWVIHRVIEEPFVDVGSIRPRGGGRRDVYAVLDMPALPPDHAADVALRHQVLDAAGHGHHHDLKLEARAR